MPKWPNLKILDLTIDSKVGDDDKIMETVDFLRFLFSPLKKRTNVQELALRFVIEKSFTSHPDQIPIPRVKDVTSTCPFVTKLTVSGWIGGNEKVTLFWEGLPLLEEVILEECERLGNAAFVGTDTDYPLFLKLKRKYLMIKIHFRYVSIYISILDLKKLSLRRLDSMSKLTDLVFKLVFRHLKIKKFSITSNIKSVGF